MISATYFVFFKLNVIGVQLLYNVVLLATVQQSQSAICIHISPFLGISIPFRSPHSTEQSSLSYTVGFQQLPILDIVSILYICQSQSPNSPDLTPPFPLGIHTSVLYVCVFISVLQIRSSIPFFLDSTYMHQYTIFLFLFLTYFTLYDSLQVHPRLYK